MPITLNEYTYPFDPTGTAPSNKVVGEVHVITQQNHRDFSFVVPDFAPFFAESLVVSFSDIEGNIVPLVEGQDYYPGHHFLAASRAIGKQVYGSISFITKNFKGTMSISYQTLGGQWTYDKTYLVELMSNSIANPRSSTWDSIVELPALFPVIDHEWDLIDMVGMSDVVHAVEDIANAIASPGEGGGGVMAHISDMNNPHQTTKEQVGLGNLGNFPLPTVEEARLALANNRYMTPIRVKDAVMAIVGDAFDLHLLNDQNPHHVTKDQVGLSDVLNFGIATSEESINGLVNNKYVTPLLVKEAIAIQVGNSVQSHLNDFENPHKVSAFQTGAYTSEQVDSLLLEKLGVNDVAADSAKFNGNTFDIVKAQILAGKSSDSGLFDGLDKEQYKSWVLLGTSANSEKLDGKTYADILADVREDSDSDNYYASQLRHENYSYVNGAEFNWTFLATLPLKDALDPSQILQDGQFLIAGGDIYVESKSTLYYLRASVRGPVGSEITLQVINLAGVNVTNNFCYRINEIENELEIWLRTPQRRNILSVTSLNKNVGTIIPASSEPIVVEPENLVYVTEMRFATKTEMDTVSIDLTTTVQELTTLFNALTV